MDIAAPGDNPAPPPRQASLKVLLGLSGANRVWHLPPIHKSASGGGGRCKGCVVFFVGDQLEGGVSQEVLRAQVIDGSFFPPRVAVVCRRCLFHPSNGGQRERTTQIKGKERRAGREGRSLGNRRSREGEG